MDRVYAPPAKIAIVASATETIKILRDRNEKSVRILNRVMETLAIIAQYRAQIYEKGYMGKPDFATASTAPTAPPQNAKKIYLV